VVNPENLRWKEKFPKLFKGMGELKGEYKIELREDAQPYAITTPRCIPLPIRKEVEEEIKGMVERGVIEPVTHATDYVSPMVVVPKGKTGKWRICVDLTKLNLGVKRQIFQLPKIDYELGLLNGAKYFSKLDAKNGFWQIKLAEESKDLTTFLTPFGRFRFCRLPFGISSAPEFFQKRMSEILSGQKNVIFHIDDILVWGKTREEHDKYLNDVLSKLQEAGFVLNEEKSLCCQSEVTFLGHHLSEFGVKADSKRIDAILGLSKPNNVSQLRQFVGTLNFVLKYIPNSNVVMQPLYDLMKQSNEFLWGIEQDRAFDKIKAILKQENALAFYDVDAETMLSCDSSSRGLGAVLLQRKCKGDEFRPVYFCSRSLTKNEMNYANIEREALAVTWACSRLEDFIIGKSITIETDHKPLLQLLQTTPVSDLTPRIQRFRLRLMRYNYRIVYTPGKIIGIADYLSRDPLPCDQQEELEEETLAYVQAIFRTIPTSDANIKMIHEKQKEDPVLTSVAFNVRTGWEKPPKDSPLVPYYNIRDELSICEDILLRGQRLVVPSCLCKDMLARIHKGHLGITKSRLRARASLWWPGMSAEIEKYIKLCEVCREHTTNPKEPLMPSQLPDRPWQNISVDLFKLENKWFVTLTDLYSRYFEITTLKNLSSFEVIQKCKSCFSRYGIPEIMRTDSGTQFQTTQTSEFQDFSRQYGFKLIRSSPHFHQSNGAAEAAVKIAKSILKKNEDDPYMALLAYRNTPIPELGKSPAELMMNRKLRDCVPIHPMVLNGVRDHKFVELDSRRRERYKENFDRRHRTRNLRPLLVGERVWINNDRKYGVVEKEAEEPRSYWLKTGNRDLRRNRYNLIPVIPAESPRTKLAMNEQSPTVSREAPTNRESYTRPPENTTRSGRVVKPPQRLDL